MWVVILDLLLLRHTALLAGIELTISIIVSGDFNEKSRWQYVDCKILGTKCRGANGCGAHCRDAVYPSLVKLMTSKSFEVFFSESR